MRRYQKFDINTDDQVVITETQDVSKTVLFCENLRKSEDKHLRKKEEFKYYAEIPVIFVEQWMREAGIETLGKEAMEIMFRKVNTEYTAFKVTDSKEVYHG